MASLAKAGQARLTREMRPSKAGKHGHSQAFLATLAPKLGLPGLATFKAELSRQAWSKKPSFPCLKGKVR